MAVPLKLPYLRLDDVPCLHIIRELVIPDLTDLGGGYSHGDTGIVLSVSDALVEREDGDRPRLLSALITSLRIKRLV